MESCRHPRLLSPCALPRLQLAEENLYCQQKTNKRKYWNRNLVALKWAPILEYFVLYKQIWHIKRVFWQNDWNLLDWQSFGTEVLFIWPVHPSILRTPLLDVNVSKVKIQFCHWLVSPPPPASKLAQGNIKIVVFWIGMGKHPIGWNQSSVGELHVLKWHSIIWQGN